MAYICEKWQFYCGGAVTLNGKWRTLGYGNNVTMMFDVVHRVKIKVT